MYTNQFPGIDHETPDKKAISKSIISNTLRLFEIQEMTKFHKIKGCI